MKTSLVEKIAYVNRGSLIASDLLEIFRDAAAITIVDCGACDGLDSVIYARMFPQARVYAIEARKDNFEELKATLKDFNAKRVIPLNYCLSDKNEETEFWSSFGDSGNKMGWDTGNKSSSILKPTGHLREHQWCRFEPGKINTVRFDQISIDRVDFLHLDVQGAELKVLRGFGEVLKTVRAIWLEVARKELYAGQPLVRDVEAFLIAECFAKRRDARGNFGDQLWTSCR
jgi:FkbM family methyltransferase